MSLMHYLRGAQEAEKGGLAITHQPGKGEQKAAVAVGKAIFFFILW